MQYPRSLATQSLAEFENCSHKSERYVKNSHDNNARHEASSGSPLTYLFQERLDERARTGSVPET